MHNPVQDTVRYRGVTDLGVPLRDRQRRLDRFWPPSNGRLRSKRELRNENASIGEWQRTTGDWVVSLWARMAVGHDPAFRLARPREVARDGFVFPLLGVSAASRYPVDSATPGNLKSLQSVADPRPLLIVVC